MKTSRQRLADRQEGFAALVIAIILVLVLSLITVGFADLMRKEERSALDKHLSSQAYYAAETGINDAQKALTAGYTGEKKDCGPLAPGDTTPGATYLKNNTVAGNSSISYTCLLIDPTPDTYEASSIGMVESKTVQIVAVDPDNPNAEFPITHLNIGWQDVDGGQSFVEGATAAGHKFTKATAWPASTGVLRLTLTPLSSGYIDRSSFVNKTYTAFLYPNKGGGPLTTQAAYPAYTVDSQGGSNLGLNGGVILNGNCDKDSAPRYCNISLNGLEQAKYLLNIRSIFKDSRVTITATDNINRPLQLKNAQTLVDSTGKAQDVLRRVQVRIPAHTEYDHSDFVLDVISGICKQLQLGPNDVNGNNPSLRDCQP